MLDDPDEEFAAWLAAAVPLQPADPLEPNWAEHPVYSSMIPPGERVAELLAIPPGARPTGELALLDPAALPEAALIDLLAMLDEQASWLESVKTRTLAAIAQQDASDSGLAEDAVSTVLRIPLRTAQTALATARTLTTELPVTLDLLTDGRITGRHAQVIAEASWTLDAEALPELEARVCPPAPDLTVPQLQARVRRAVIALDPATAEARHQRALAGRRVGFQSLDDGMAALHVVLDAAQGQLIYTRLTAAARLVPNNDKRTMSQRRADLLVDAVLTGLPHDALPELQGHRPTIQVVVSADTLLELNDEPADLAGYGPITAETARRMAADESSTWRRLLTDSDTGQLLDISERRYKPSQRLRDYVMARDGVCCYPTCNQPGYRCEIEHITPFLQAGMTTRGNTALACKRHNNAKAQTGWRYRRNADDTVTWTAPTGHTSRNHPPERWSITTARPPVPPDLPAAEPAPPDDPPF